MTVNHSLFRCSSLRLLRTVHAATLRDWGSARCWGASSSGPLPSTEPSRIWALVNTFSDQLTDPRQIFKAFILGITVMRLSISFMKYIFWQWSIYYLYVFHPGYLLLLFIMSSLFQWIKYIYLLNENCWLFIHSFTFLACCLQKTWPKGPQVTPLFHSLYKFSHSQFLLGNETYCYSTLNHKKNPWDLQ